MAASSQIRRDAREWAVFRFNPHVEADPEPYRSLVLERQRIQAMEDRIHLRKMTGGRKRKRVIDHAKKEHDMRKEYFGFKEIVNRAGCILAEAVAAECTKQEFHRNFRMSDYLFDRIHKDITDPKWGCTRFLKRPDAVGHFGPSSLQKIYSVIHQLAFGSSSFAVKDTVEYGRIWGVSVCMTSVSSSSAATGETIWGGGIRLQCWLKWPPTRREGSLAC